MKQKNFDSNQKLETKFIRGSTLLKKSLSSLDTRNVCNPYSATSRFTKSTPECTSYLFPLRLLSAADNLSLLVSNILLFRSTSLPYMHLVYAKSCVLSTFRLLHSEKLFEVSLQTLFLTVPQFPAQHPAASAFFLPYARLVSDLPQYDIFLYFPLI